MNDYNTIKKIKFYWYKRGYKALFKVPDSIEGTIKIYLFGKKNIELIEKVKIHHAMHLEYCYIFNPKILYYFYKKFRKRFI